MALFMFNRVLTPPAYTAGDNNTELVLDLGATTLVNMTSSASVTFVGMSASSGNVDGMTVCLSHVNGTGSFALTYAHESSVDTTPANRFRNAALTAATGGNGAGAVWYRYCGSLQRWIELAHT